MKVYCFFLYSDDISGSEYKGIQLSHLHLASDFAYSIYAYTNDKETAQIFRHSRNMNIFFEKVIDISRKDYYDFTLKNSKFLLDYRGYMTQVVRDGKMTTDVAIVLSTRNEGDTIAFSASQKIEEMFSVWEQTYEFNMPIDMMKQKIQKALNKVLLFRDMIEWINIFDDLPYNSFMIDELSMYVYLYKNTYNEKELIKLCKSGDFIKSQQRIQRTSLRE